MDFVAPTSTPTHACTECEGRFLTHESLLQHLQQHELLRAIQSGVASATAEEKTPEPTTPAPANEPSRVAKKKTKSSLPPAPGFIQFFDEAKGFGFIKRTAPGAATGQVFFHLSACNLQTLVPKRGDVVTFTEKVSNKGAIATSVILTPPPTAAAQTASTPADGARPAEPVVEAAMDGVVASYKAEGGFGAINVGETELYFSIHACDVKRPPPTVGERVVVISQTVGPKGPTASGVQRLAIPEAAASAPKAKAAPGANKEEQDQTPTGDAQATSIFSTLTAFGRFAIGMVTGAKTSVAAVDPSASRKPSESAAQKPAAQHFPGRRTDTTPLRPAHYQHMISMLSDPEASALYLPAAATMLARTRPRKAQKTEGLEPEIQRLLLLSALEDELLYAQQTMA